MTCPISSLSGLVQINGIINQENLNVISEPTYPFTTAFVPISTRPILNRNIINDPNMTSHSCVHNGEVYIGVDIQICEPIHKGYLLPSSPSYTQTPVYELVLSFTSKYTYNAHSGMLICFPIYISDTTYHDQYLSSVIKTIRGSFALNTDGNIYDGDYLKQSNASLYECVKECINDINCKAFTHYSNKCKLSDSISATTNDLTKPDAKSGAIIDRGDENKLSNTVSLDSLFVGSPVQTSLSYKTCFETGTIDNKVNIRSLHVVVFPNGITISNSMHKSLMLHLHGVDTKYVLPQYIYNGFGGEKTYKDYDMKDSIKALKTKSDGILYITQIEAKLIETKMVYHTISPPPAKALKADCQTNVDKYKCFPLSKDNQYFDGQRGVQLSQIVKDRTQVKMEQANPTKTLELTEDDKTELKAILIVFVIIIVVFIIPYAVNLNDVETAIHSAKDAKQKIKKEVKEAIGSDSNNESKHDVTPKGEKGEKGEDAEEGKEGKKSGSELAIVIGVFVVLVISTIYCIISALSNDGNNKDGTMTTEKKLLLSTVGIATLVGWGFIIYYFYNYFTKN